MSETSTESVKKYGNEISCSVGRDMPWIAEMPLPIPFVNGKPADIDKMTVDQLKNFITFAYSSHYKKKIPDIDSTDGPPTWWTKAIVFDNTLKLTPGYYMRWHGKYLVELICQFYDAFHCRSLLRISSDLAYHCSDYSNGISNGAGNVFKPASLGKTFVAVDHSTRTYDLSTQAEQNAFETEMASNRETQIDPKDPNNCPIDNNKRTPSQRSTLKNYISVPAAKVASKQDQDDFMNTLGMSNVSKVESGTSLSTVLPLPISQPANMGGRKLRKLASRIPFLSIITKNPFLPITSGPGLHLLSKLGGKIEQKDIVYPPPYESHCQAISGQGMHDRRRPKDLYPVNTDPNILKDGSNPHIYSYGRGKRQRAVRNQELVLGLNRRCWPALRKCKNVCLHLKKIHPATKKLQVGAEVSGTSFLMRAFQAATLQSRIKIVDCMKYPDSTTMPYVSKLLGKSSQSPVLQRPRNVTPTTMPR